jgi:hypothetical protein
MLDICTYESYYSGYVQRHGLTASNIHDQCIMSLSPSSHDQTSVKLLIRIVIFILQTLKCLAPCARRVLSKLRNLIYFRAQNQPVTPYIDSIKRRSLMKTCLT